MEAEFQVHAIALKTLKQRCEYLQERLNAVEEENCKLKLEKAQDLNKRTFNRIPSSDLEEQILLLNEEKSQMSHQIKILSSENFALWTQLSEFSPGKDVSAENLAFSNVIDGQVSKFKGDSTSNDFYGAYSKESLEEISLKLINGIRMGKNELEKQYCQMIDLQRENDSDVKNVTYISKHSDKRTVMKNLKDHVQKLKDIKEALYQQKNDLSNGIMVLKNLEVFPRNSVSTGSGDYVHFRNEIDGNVNHSESKFSELENLRRVLTGEDWQDESQMVCPVCGENFTGRFTDFKSFYNHVCDCFSNESDEC